MVAAWDDGVFSVSGVCELRKKLEHSGAVREHWIWGRSCTLVSIGE